MGRKKQDEPRAFDDERLLLNAQSPDEEVRGDAVRSLCPCHAGWEAFERNVSVVLHALRDRSRSVRAHALHVFDDAARMQHVAESVYESGDTEERAHAGRAGRARGRGGRRRSGPRPHEVDERRAKGR